MQHGQEKVLEYLRLAYGQEKALIGTLQGHVAMARDGEYKSTLEHHLTETTGHARQIRQRLNELGYQDQEHILQRGIGFVQSVAMQGMSIAKAPIDMLRGKGSPEETMLKNARDEAMTEAAEIATYLTIESIADGEGDGKTAELARSIRADEERMLGKLGEAIPKLAQALIKEDPAPPLTSVRKAS